jgi:hypothetical protein
MVKDEQMVRLRQLLRPSTTLKELALQANMDTKTARKYIRLSIDASLRYAGGRG